MKSGSSFLAEISRMISSFRPGGTASASIGVTNPYWYSLSASSLIVLALVIVSPSPSRPRVVPASATSANPREGGRRAAVENLRHPPLAAHQVRQHRPAQDSLEQGLEHPPERAYGAVAHVGADGQISGVLGAVIGVVEPAAQRMERLGDAHRVGAPRQRVAARPPEHAPDQAGLAQLADQLGDVRDGQPLLARYLGQLQRVRVPGLLALRELEKAAQAVLFLGGHFHFRISPSFPGPTPKT